jgi:hypothetical protein
MEGRHDQAVCYCEYVREGKQHIDGEPAEDTESEWQSELEGGVL